MSMDYDPSTEAGPEVSPGVRIVEERTGVEIRGVYDGVSAWIYADGRIVNRWAEGEWRGSRRDYETQLWLDQYGQRVLADLYPKET